MRDGYLFHIDGPLSLFSATTKYGLQVALFLPALLHCQDFRLEAEVRSVDQQRVEAVATEMIDHMQDAADAGECDLDITVERMIHGYRTRPKATQVVVAERALEACGYEPRHIITGGASGVELRKYLAFDFHALEHGFNHKLAL